VSDAPEVMDSGRYDRIQQEFSSIRSKIQAFVLELDFRDHRRIGEHMPAKIPKDVDKLQDLINPVAISKKCGDLIYKTQQLTNEISRLMTLHTAVADSVYLVRTHGDIVQKRRQAQIDLKRLEAEEAEKQRKREEEDALAAATKASLEEAAGISKSRKRSRRQD